MSSDGYSPPPSHTYSRSPSIDPTKHVSHAPQPAAPNISSLLVNGSSQPQFPSTSQRSLLPDQFIGKAPVLSDVHPVVNSSNEISTQGSVSTQAPGFTAVGQNRLSEKGVAEDVVSELPQPTISDLAERERSNSGEAEDLVEYEGFTPIDPEEYDME